MATNTGYVDFNEAAAPATPAASKVRLYCKSDGLLYSKDDAGTETLVSGGAGGGSVATDTIWDAAGDLAVGTGANTAAKLTKGAAGTVPTAGASTLAYAYPPGYVYGYAEATSNVNVTSTTTGDQIVTLGALTFDGATDIYVEFYAAAAAAAYDAAGRTLGLMVYDGAALGWIAYIKSPATTETRYPILARRKLTPSNGSHTYAIRGVVSAGTGIVYAGNGSGSAYMPAYIRVVQA